MRTPSHMFAIFLLPWAALAWLDAPTRAQELPATLPATVPAGFPAPDEIRRQVEAAQYREALRSLLRILELKGPAAAAYDRAEMLLLRAECQLQIRQMQAAQDSLEDAVKVAAAATPPDVDRIDDARALSALLAKSPAMSYTPRTRSGPLAPKPINILDRAARPAAFASLFRDSLADVKARVRATELAPTVPPFLEAAEAVATLRALERAGTGAVVESRALGEALVTRASILLGNSLTEMSRAVDGIAASANLSFLVPMQRVDPVTGVRLLEQFRRRRGLGNEDGARLKSIQQTCAQIAAACQELALALDSDAFHPLYADAQSLSRRIAEILGDDYSRMPT